MNNNSDVYTIRYKKHNVVMQEVSIEEVKRYFTDNDPTDYVIEVTYIEKACCPETYQYKGSFEAKKMYPRNS